MSEEIKFTDEQIEEAAKKWEDKKCLACGTPTTAAEYAGLLYPYYMFAESAIQEADSYTEGLPPMVSMAALNRFELFKILLATTCTVCGHVSLWEGSQLDILALKKNIDDGGVYLGASVTQERLEDAIKHSTSNWMRKSLEMMLGWMKKVEKDNE